MGFMAGFGSAFADSFNKENDRLAQQQEDTFRLQYSDYVSQRDYRQKMDLENKKNLRMARNLVSTAGQPPEAVQSAYEMLSGGMSPEYIAKYLSENQATVSSSNTTKPGEGATASDAQPADPRDNLSGSAQSSVDSQMAASGMKAPESGGIFGNLKKGMHDVFSSEGQGQRAASRSTERIAGASGVSQDEVQNTLSGKSLPGDPIDGMSGVNVKWTPKGTSFEAMDVKANNLGDAQALAIWAEAYGTPEQKMYANNKLEKFKQLKTHEIQQNAFALDPSKAPQRGMIRKKDGTGYEDQFVTADYSNGDPANPIWRDQQGNEVDPKTIAAVGQNQEKDMQAVAKEGSEGMKPYQEEKVNLNNFVRTSNDYIKLLKDNNGKYDGKAMDLSGNVTQFVDRWRRAGINIADLVMPKGNIEDATVAISELDKAEKKIRNELDTKGKDGLIDRVAQNAMKASLIDIQGTKLAYQMAAQANGSTKGISNLDFQNYKNIVSGNGNPATAAQALAISIKQAQANIGSMEQNIKTGKGDTSYYKGKYPNAPTGFDMGSSFDDESKNDPELSQAMKDIFSAASQEDNPGAQVVNPDEVGTPEWVKNSGKSIVGLDGADVPPGMWKHMSPALQEAIKKKNGIK